MNQEQIECLSHPQKSFRLAAVEKLLEEKPVPELIEALKKRQECEDDSECMVLLQHAISRICRRLETSSGDSKIPSEKTDWLGKYQSSAFEQRVELLAGISPALTVELAPEAPSLLEAESNPAVASIIVKTFGLKWPKDSLNSLAKRLTIGNLSLRLAALNILTERVPEALLEALPVLLRAEDPRTRALAIRGLAKLDVDEAVNHFDALLSSRSRDDKLSALENSFYFPFERIKPVLLKFLAAESEPSLLVRAGVLCCINPDIEVPYRLWEIIEKSPSEKAKTLRKIFSEACRILKASGLLKEEYPKFFRRLQKWIHRRIDEKMVRDLITRIATNPEQEAEIEGLFMRSLEKPAFREALQTAFTWPLANEMKEKLRQIFEKSMTSETPRIPPEAEVPFPEAGIEEKSRRLALMKPEDKDKVIPIIDEALNRKDLPESYRATIIRTALRLNLGQFKDRIVPFIREPSSRSAQNADRDMNLASAAIEYTAHFDLDQVLPFLGKYLNSAESRLQTLAIKIINRHDPAQAVSSLFASLKKGDMEKKLAAMSCLVNFDFALVRENLAGYLKNCPEKNLFESGICLFQINPGQENLYPLFCLSKSINSENCKLVQEAIKQCAEFLVAEGIISPEEAQSVEGKLQEKWDAEQAKKAAPPPPYSLRALKAREEEEKTLWFLFTNPLFTAKLACSVISAMSPFQIGTTAAVGIGLIVGLSQIPGILSDGEPPERPPSQVSTNPKTPDHPKPGVIYFPPKLQTVGKPMKDTRRTRKSLERLPFEEFLKARTGKTLVR